MRKLFTALVLSLVATTAVAQTRPNAEIAADLERLAAELRGPAPVTVIPAATTAELRAAATQLSASGGVIELTAGVSYPGPIALPKRPAGSPFIDIRSSAALPERPVNPGDAALFATIAPTTSEPALSIIEASNYRISGVRVARQPNGYYEGIVVTDSSDVYIDRIWIDAPQGQKRGIRLNGKNTFVTRSYIDTGAWVGQDSQAITIWEGGPATITDNYLAASGENILVGGAWTAGRGEEYVPQDILVARNYLHKPEAWRAISGSVKNLFELKNAKRVVVRDNILDGNWTDAQSGWGIVFTVRNQDGNTPFATIQDVLFERNVVRNSVRGVNILAFDDQPSVRMARVTIRKNVFETMPGAFMLIHGGVQDLTVEDNVTENGQNIVGMYVGKQWVDGVRVTEPIAVYNLKWNRNVHRDVDYGVHSSNFSIGTATLNGMTQGYEFTGNRLLNKKYNYPAGNVAITQADFDAAKAALLAELGR